VTLFFLCRRQAAKLAAGAAAATAASIPPPLRLRLLHSPSSPPPLRRSPCHAPLRYMSPAHRNPSRRREPEIRTADRPRASTSQGPPSSLLFRELATCSVRDLGDLFCPRTLDAVGGPELHTWRLARPCLLPIASNTTQTRATDLISFLRRYVLICLDF
jgi:hypothetical protein